MIPEKSVLVVDDDVSIAHLLQRILEQEGYLVVLASNGYEASKIANETHFDAALVDYKMPDMDGLMLLRHLREVQPQCLRLLISGILDLDLVMSAINRGEVVRVISKPFEGPELIANLKEAFDAQACIWKTILGRRPGEESSVGEKLQECFAGDAFRLALQPIVSASSLKVVGFEALLRCSHPDFSTPLRVLSATKTLGLIDELADVVAQKAAAWLSTLPEEFLLLINLHPLELNAPDRLAIRTRALLPWAKRVVFEVTECDQIVSQQRFRESVDLLRKQGFALALDDLGAGYNSLTMLLELEPNYVKLDRSLVCDVHLDGKKQRLVGYLVELSKRMGAAIVGEGVETLEEASFLRECGVDFLQGFLFGKPSFEPQTSVVATSFR